MIQEDYVSFEQAKDLKELGFPWGCTEHLYDKDGIIDGNFIDYPLYQCPTLSLVQKWLREDKNLDIDINSHKGLNYKYYTVYLPIRTDCILDNNDRPIQFDTYEQALSAGIDICIELLK